MGFRGFWDKRLAFCLNARRIRAGTPQIADYMDCADYRGF